MTSIGPTRSGAFRRRRALNEPSRKATFQIRESVLQAMKAVTKEGIVPSMSVLIEQAVEQKLRDLRRDRLYSAYDAAANDPAFMAELDETARAFDHTVADGLAEGA